MDKVTTSDGLALAVRPWPCAGARGHVLLVHGLGEHAGRYDTLARDLNAAGFAVTSYDQRGHGRSPGPRGVIPAPDSLCADLAAVIDALHAAGQPPTVLLGHSLGGLVAARFTAEALAQAPAAWSRPVPRLVLSSPALDPGMSGLQKALLAVLGRLAPHLAVNNGLQPDWISRDPAVVHAYVQDPLVHDRVARAPGALHRRWRRTGARAGAVLEDTHAADVGRRRPLRGAGWQRRLCRRRAAGSTRRGCRRWPTRSSTSPSGRRWSLCSCTT
jgi:alpha-beta hydrolase superfamily lysophospholipase